MGNQTLAEEILKQYKNGKRHFKNLDVEGDFSNSNLKGILFEECFIAADFKYCNLKNAKFINGNIKTSDFRYSDLTNSVFKNLAVESTQFDWAKTDGLIFEGNFSYGQEVNPEDFDKVFKTNKSKPKFLIVDMVKLTKKGLVIYGDIKEGKIANGDEINLDTISYKINNVEMLDTVNGRIAHIGLVIPVIEQRDIDRFKSLKGKIIEITKK